MRVLTLSVLNAVSHHTVFLKHTAMPRSGTRSSPQQETLIQNMHKIITLSGVTKEQSGKCITL